MLKCVGIYGRMRPRKIETDVYDLGRKKVIVLAKWERNPEMLFLAQTEKHVYFI